MGGEEKVSVSNVLLGLFLLWNTGTDLKKREISYLSVLLFVITGILLFIRLPEKNVISIAGGAAVGICLLLLSLLFRGAIGFGDGMVVLVCGVFVGFFKNLILLMTGFLLTAIIGIVLIVFKRAGRKTCLPFVPFLTISYGLLVLGGVL